MDDASPTLGSIAPVGGCARPGRIAVIYDGECALCRVGAEAVRVFDNSNAIDLIDLHQADARAQFPDLTIDALMEELHVVDDRGQLWRGARGQRSAAPRAWTARMVRLPVVHPGLCVAGRAPVPADCTLALWRPAGEQAAGRERRAGAAPRPPAGRG